MKFEPDKLRFEGGGISVEMDLVDAHIRLDEIQRNCPEGNEGAKKVLEGIKEWFATDFGMTLSTTQAFTVSTNIGYAFADYKKKLSLTLVSDSGIPLTPQRSPMGWFGRLTRCFRHSSQSEKSRIDWEALISQQIASGNL